MSTDNERIMQRIWSESVCDGELATLDELVSPDFVYHSNTDNNGVEGAKRIATAFRSAFPDVQIHIEEQFSADDKVVSRIRITGTQSGDFGDIPPTNRRIDVRAISIARCENGQVVEEWEEIDQLGMLQQLGVVG